MHGPQTGKLGRERSTLLVIQVEYERPLPRQRFTYRLCVDVGIAIHIPANPGSKTHEVWKQHMLAFLAIDAVDGRAYVLVERRHRAVQNVRDEKQYVLELVGDGHRLRRMLVGLPARGREQANILQSRVCLLRCHRRVQKIDEMFDDVLFLAKYRTPRWLGRMCREYGLDQHRVEQCLQALDVHA